MEIFHFPYVYSTAKMKQSMRFLECVEDNLTQVVRELAGESTPLDLLFAYRKGLVDDVVVGGCLGHGDCEVIEFLIFCEVRNAVRRTTASDFQMADFDLFRDLINKVIPRLRTGAVFV